MNLSQWKRRWAATLMLTVIVAAFVVPAAQAGMAHYRRWKPGPNGYSYSTRPVVRSYPRYYQRTSSGAAPFVAGLIGGAILGTALSQSHAHASVAASYYDPYCDIRFGSLDACRAHFRGCGHPEVIRMVEGGRYTRDLCWQNGGWQDYRGGWSGDFSYRSRDGRDDGGQWNDRRDGGQWNDRRDGGQWNDRRDGGQWNDRNPRWKDDGGSRWKDDRGWNGRRDDPRDDRRWNERRDTPRDDPRWNDQRDDDDRNFRNRDDDGDSDDDDGDN